VFLLKNDNDLNFGRRTKNCPIKPETKKTCKKFIRNPICKGFWQSNSRKFDYNGLNNGSEEKKEYPMNSIKRIISELVNMVLSLMEPRPTPVPIPVRNEDRRR
jgi:hypothetical protein